jgi:hypothetical protein
MVDQQVTSAMGLSLGAEEVGTCARTTVRIGQQEL